MGGFLYIGKYKYIWLGISVCCGCQCVPVLSGFIRRWVSVRVGGVAQFCVAMCCLCVQLVPSLYWLSAVVILLIGSFGSLDEAGSFTVLWLFTARHLYCWLELYCVLPFLYSKRTVLFTVCAYCLVPAVWWCLLYCCILPQFVWTFLVGKRFPVFLSWGGSLCVWWLVEVFVGA